jgi:hypothetical protein
MTPMMPSMRRSHRGGEQGQRHRKARRDDNEDTTAHAEIREVTIKAIPEYPDTDSGEK